MFEIDNPFRKYLLFAEGDEEGGGGEAPPEGDPEGTPEGDPPPNGADPDDWRAGIEDKKLRDHAGRFTSIDALVEANLNQRRELSKAVVPLGKDPTDEEIASYRKSVGIPESPDGYEFSFPEGYEPTEADTQFQKSASEAFHNLNISAETANGLAEWWSEFSSQMLQEQISADKEFADESEAALRKEWPGEEFNRNKAFADQAAAKVFGDDLDEIRGIETKDGRFVLDHPAFIKMLATYGREMQEGKLGPPSEQESMDIQKQIDELQTKMEKAQVSGDRETANRLYREQQELYRRQYGAGPIVGAEGRAV